LTLLEYSPPSLQPAKECPGIYNMKHRLAIAGKIDYTGDTKSKEMITLIS
jgi:hypothetical protein